MGKVLVLLLIQSAFSEIIGTRVNSRNITRLSETEGRFIIVAMENTFIEVDYQGRYYKQTDQSVCGFDFINIEDNTVLWSEGYFVDIGRPNNEPIDSFRRSGPPDYFSSSLYPRTHRVYPENESVSQFYCSSENNLFRTILRTIDEMNLEIYHQTPEESGEFQEFTVLR